MDPRNRDRWLIAALLVAVFMAGALGGAAAWQIFGRRPPAATLYPPARGPGMGPGGGFGRGAGPGRGLGMAGGPGRVGLTEGLADRLGLTADQRARIDSLLERQRLGTDHIMENLRPRLQAHLDSTNARIRAVLTPEQRAIFDAYVAGGRGRIMGRLPPPDGGANQDR